MMLSLSRLLILSSTCLAMSIPAAASAQEPEERPTIQDRFAPKDNLVYLQPLGMMHLRDDFYRSWGVGGELGFFLSESFAIDVRVVSLQTSLADAAIDLKERIGLTPDARPQDLWALGGVRWAPGYGKILMFGSFVQHLDPQLVLRGGVARAEARWLPTINPAFSTMLHFRWGINATIELGASIQREGRERGEIWTVGFAPSLGIGWGYNL